jgi:hypothetical protein
MNKEPAITGHHELCYPTEYVKAADLRGKDVTVVVDHLEWEGLVMAGGKRDRKVAVHLRSVGGKKLEKRLIVGKTNLRSMAACIGETDVSRWSGQKVTLYPTTCRGADGRPVECIRVRVKTNASAGEVPDEMSVAPPPRVEFVDDAKGAVVGVTVTS